MDGRGSCSVIAVTVKEMGDNMRFCVRSLKWEHLTERGERFRLAIACAVCLWTILCAISVRVHGAETPYELVARGNRLYEEGKYDKAKLAYDDAKKSLPESPEIYFDLGNVAYRKGDYEGAEECFLNAAESANATRQLRKKALYNLGNCAFRKGEKLLDSDLQKAIDSFKRSILQYHDVIAGDEYDRESRGGEFKEDEDAKYNIEVARLRIKDILDKLKQQEEKRKEQQKQQEEFIRKLKEAIEKQAEIVKDTGDARDRKEKAEDVSESVDDLKKRQGENKDRTGELAEELQKQIDAAKAQASQGGSTSAPLDQNLTAAKESLSEAEIEQGTAVQHLDEQALADAKTSEESALRNLQDALGKLTKPQSPQAQPEEGQEKQQAQEKPEEKQEEGEKTEPQRKGDKEEKMTPEEAQEELAKLRKQASDMRERNLQNFLRQYPNFRQRKREYEPVERDW